MLILDTDHLAALDRGTAVGQRLAHRLETAADDVATTIISAEEQLRGWLAQIHRLDDPHQQVAAYERLQRRLEFLPLGMSCLGMSALRTGLLRSGGWEFVAVRWT